MHSYIFRCSKCNADATALVHDGDGPGLCPGCGGGDGKVMGPQDGEHDMEICLRCKGIGYCQNDALTGNCHLCGGTGEIMHYPAAASSTQPTELEIQLQASVDAEKAKPRANISVLPSAEYTPQLLFHELEPHLDDVHELVVVAQMQDGSTKLGCSEEVTESTMARAIVQLLLKLLERMKEDE